MPPKSPSLAIASRRVVMPDGVQDAAVLVDREKVVGVVSPDEIPNECERREYGDLVIMAGLVDSHVHVNEPGRTEWEGFRTATMAAAAGGVTTIVDMPLNSTPVTTSADALDQKLEATQGKLFVDSGFYAGLVPGSVSELEPMLERGVFGVKAFMIDSGIGDFPPADQATIERAMAVIAQSSTPLLVHAELRGDAEAAGSERAIREYADYLATRPPVWETDAISLLADLSIRHRCHVHVVHLATSKALSIIREARSRGARMTVETCPHYLFFDAESIPTGQTLFKCAPPIRDRRNNDQLFAALREGVIDFVASDHSPTTPSEKAMETGDLSKAWGGIASIQLRLPVMWTLARSAQVSLSELALWLAQRPAEFLGIGDTKGAISAGHDADLVVWSPESDFVVRPDMLHDRHKLTPYEGERLFGTVKATYLRGVPVFEDGGFTGPHGRVLVRG